MITKQNLKINAIKHQLNNLNIDIFINSLVLSEMEDITVN